jgi:hypothetical protein
MIQMEPICLFRADKMRLASRRSVLEHEIAPGGVPEP